MAKGKAAPRAGRGTIGTRRPGGPSAIGLAAAAALVWFTAAHGTARAQVVVGGDGGASAVTVDQGVLDALGPAPAGTAPPPSGPPAGAPVNIRPQTPYVPPPAAPMPAATHAPAAAEPPPEAEPAATQPPEPEPAPQQAVEAAADRSQWQPPPPGQRPPVAIPEPAPVAEELVAEEPPADVAADTPSPQPAEVPQRVAPFQPPRPGLRPQPPAAPVEIAEAAPPENDGVVADVRPEPPEIPDAPGIVATSPPAPPVPEQVPPADVPDRPDIVADAPPPAPVILGDHPAVPREADPEMDALTSGEEAAAETQLASLPPSLGGGAMAMDEETLTIPFTADAIDLPAAALPVLDELANRMEANPGLRLQVLAYASGGSGSAARSTSLNRAIAVRSYLMDRDIRRTRIDVRALGDTASDGSPDRIDLVIAP
ncbi:MAG: hypothetical protein H6843_09765 [Rhodospirillaceae bacterium]|nr:hypothetical protein [Rhodospirillaceae bacterium]